jgi:hypothetical protein
MLARSGLRHRTAEMTNRKQEGHRHGKEKKEKKDQTA